VRLWSVVAFAAALLAACVAGSPASHSAPGDVAASLNDFGGELPDYIQTELEQVFDLLPNPGG
jgi:hypothetical protein